MRGKMQFDFKIIFGSISRGCIWFRLGRRGRGVVFKKSELLFSERYGITWYLKLPFGWRMNLLRADFQGRVKNRAVSSIYGPDSDSKAK